MNSRVGWISTWNVQCGIASYAAHLMEAVPDDDYVVFAARRWETLGPDPANCIRCWTEGKGPNGLDEITRQLASWSVGALVIQHNYGFFDHFELNDFIVGTARQGITVLVELHSTTDPMEADNWRLAELAPGLRLCDRVLAHGPADMNRLKSLGLVDNVMFFPHGVVNRNRGVPAAARPGKPPRLASFGFALPNKGLLQLVQAVGILRDQGLPMHLLMLNAELSIPEAADLVRAIKEEIVRLGLENAVDFRTEYLDDDTCLELLASADLVVNPYQRTGESASGAVRYGIAAGRPVAVTPLAIFDDLGSAVFRMPGTTPPEIAEGIAEALWHIERRSETAVRIEHEAHRWLEAHDVARQGLRLMQLVRTLHHGSPSRRRADAKAIVGEKRDADLELGHSPR